MRYVLGIPKNWFILTPKFFHAYIHSYTNYKILNEYIYNCLIQLQHVELWRARRRRIKENKTYQLHKEYEDFDQAVKDFKINTINLLVTNVIINLKKYCSVRLSLEHDQESSKWFLQKFLKIIMHKKLT